MLLYSYHCLLMSSPASRPPHFSAYSCCCFSSSHISSLYLPVSASLLVYSSSLDLHPSLLYLAKCSHSLRHHPGSLFWSLHCQCKRHGLDPWVGKIPWIRTWQPTPVFLPGVIPWTEEPGELWSIGSQRIGHDWSDLARMEIYHISAFSYYNIMAGSCLPLESMLFHRWEPD